MCLAALSSYEQKRHQNIFFKKEIAEPTTFVFRNPKYPHIPNISKIIAIPKIYRHRYNKFLEIADNVKVNINQEKIREDAQWDGLKGYITNTTLPAEQVYEQYRSLWVVERAYRVTKGTLEMRPMFHFTPRRIEAHVCIRFVAYKVYKELERILKANGINLSVDKVLAIAKTITTLNVKMPHSRSSYTKTMLVIARHKLIA